VAGRDLADIIGGAALVLFGASVVVTSIGYGLGTPVEMGAGFFPAMVGAAVAAAGVAVLIPSLFRHAERPAPSWRAALGILASIAAFALAVEQFGLLPAVAATALIAGLTDPQSKIMQAVMLAAALALGSWLIFIKGLGLPMSAFRSPF